MVMANEHVTVHMVFIGHFTGSFGNDRRSTSLQLTFSNSLMAASRITGTSRTISHFLLRWASRRSSSDGLRYRVRTGHHAVAAVSTGRMLEILSVDAQSHS